MAAPVQDRDESGFTLIELLVVILIIGVLATVVVLSVGSITDRGETAAEKADRATLTHAEETFLANVVGPQKYATEAQLVPTYMSEPSTVHDICLSANKKAYKIVTQAAAGVDSCAGVTVPNG